MARNKIDQMLQKKDPALLRRNPIKPVSILNAAAETEQENEQENPIHTTQEIDRTEKQNYQSDEETRSPEVDKKTVRNKRSGKSNQKAERKQRSIYSQQDIQALLEIKQRAKERYSFEIYTDQKEDIQQICEHYENATGKKLSASRLIREVLDSFIPDALKAFDKTDE